MEYINAVDLYNEAKKYENVQSIELVNLFKEAHVFFPDFINRFILLSILKKHVFVDDLIKTFPPEFVYKLKNYNFFSIYLLTTIIDKYKIKVDAKEYKNVFMRFYLQNQKKFKIAQSFEKELESFKDKKGPKETIDECIKNFSELFYTPKGYLDGLNLSIIKEAINATFSIADLEALAKNHKVEIPKRLNKNELVSLISARLLLNDEEKAMIQVKPIADICQYSKQKGFRISPDLKKADMVEYLVYSLGKYHEDTEKDLYNYDILIDIDDPKTNLDQEELVHDDSIPVSANLVDAPVIEPIKVEEPKSEEVVTTKSQDAEIINEPQVIEKETIEPIKETKKESKKEKQLKEEMDNAIYYDSQVDQEIREIIKKYYSKKKQKDKVFRISIIILLTLILATGVVLVLKLLNIF